MRESNEKVAIQATQNLHLEINFQDDVRFQGQYNYDDVELEGNNMAYPGDSGAAFLTAILVHAVAADSKKNSALSQAQMKANYVLKPYEKYLREFENDELVSSVIAKLNDNFSFQLIKYDRSKTKPTDLRLKSEPVFFMSQDQRELILQHSMSVYRIGEPDKILHKNAIEVSSNRIEQKDIFAFWVNDNNLPKISAELYAISVDLFINDMFSDLKNAEKSKQKTFRYVQGGKKKYERGILVKDECNRTTIRTLRGWLKSFPSNTVVPAGNANNCKDGSYVDRQMLVDLSKIDRI